ncbi:MAG: hypothetical protein R3B45_15130 [Bdellovibrionota bacterium]
MVEVNMKQILRCFSLSSIILLNSCGVSSQNSMQQNQSNSNNSHNSLYYKGTSKKNDKATLTLSIKENQTDHGKKGDGVSEKIDIMALVADVSVWTDKKIILNRQIRGPVEIALPINATASESYMAFKYAIKKRGWHLTETESTIKISVK